MAVTYAEGTGDYYDSLGEVSCIFNSINHACPGDNSRADGAMSKNSTTLTGVYPFLWGVSVDDLIGGGTDIYNALNKDVTGKEDKTKYSIYIPEASATQHIYIAYPFEHGLLSTIKDGKNGFYIASTGSLRGIVAILLKKIEQVVNF